ncbi:type I secretion system permease/ATPase, partial [Polynucleobacter paneuropaeus]|nr:type I secretion system permease/ATPase [Polynucleobacter paneuropaeus]MBT8532748.1 type I secretion system permease/ATPase [Polynucleobacter paneuropaeus]
MNIKISKEPDANPDADSNVNAEAKIDSGLWAILSMAALHGISADASKITHDFGAKLTNQQILLAARDLGMTAKLIKQDVSRMNKAPLPAVAISKEGEYFIVAKLIEEKLLIQHPGQAPLLITLDELFSLWTGEFIFFTSKASFAGAMARFDFTWFIPAIVKYRKLLGEILIISLALQLVALITPMFFQVVMDKVLVNHAMKTLNVIAIGLICSMVFEAALNGIRT